MVAVAMEISSLFKRFYWSFKYINDSCIPESLFYTSDALNVLLCKDFVFNVISVCIEEKARDEIGFFFREF